MAILLRASGAREDITPEGGQFRLEALQRYVGGYIEIVRGPGADRYLVINEDGARLELPINVEATFLYRQAGGLPGFPVLGDVVICSWAELEGEGAEEA